MGNTASEGLHLARQLHATWVSAIALQAVCVLFSGCRSTVQNEPTIEFSRIPQADQGSQEKHEIIVGRVTNARPGQEIVLYSRSGAWWVQPLATQPRTKIQPNSTWINATHLGTEYAALLVDPGYQPPASAKMLPVRGGPVAAVAVVPGRPSPASQYLQFSGYEWRLRDAPSSRGGSSNIYDPKNAWTDANGALHLRITGASGKWTCSEVSLTRSLGYGTYTFVVRDVSRLEPAAVFSMFTWDYSGADENYHEIDIEISRWGDPASKNAQYVIQPYYVPANVVRFAAPSGTLTHSLRWEPGRLSFRTSRGSRTVAQHVFTSGVPSPGIESVRMNLYVSHIANTALENGAEVVIEKFEYLP
jgi:hypothetical protein